MIISYLPSFLSPSTLLTQSVRHILNLEILFHVAAKCVSWGSRNKNRVILDFSRNLGNLFGKYTGQVVKLDARLKKKSDFTFKVPENHFHSNLKWKEFDWIK